MSERFNHATIEILNWERHNPRNDLKRTHWFRLSNTILEDAEFIDFTDAELLCYIYVLSMCSKLQRGTLKISRSHVERIGGRKWDDFVSTIKKLQENQIVRVVETNPNVHVTSPSHYITEQNRTEQNRTEEIIHAPHDENLSGEKNICTTSSPSVSKLVLPELFEQSIENLLLDIKPIVQKKWVETYADCDWIKFEIKKASTWLAVNSEKSPRKRIDRFLTNWLSRAWEHHRKTLPSNPMPSQRKSMREILADEGGL